MYNSYIHSTEFDLEDINLLQFLFETVLVNQRATWLSSMIAITGHGRRVTLSMTGYGHVGRTADADMQIGLFSRGPIRVIGM
jgi:hypothetical protein